MRSYSTIFITLCFLAIAVSCDKDDESDDNLAKFDFFECKINGEPFKAVSDFTCSGPRFDYYPEAFLSVPEGYAFFSGRHCPTSEGTTIRVYGLEHKTGTLSFTEPVFADSISPFYRFIDTDGSIVKFESLVDGEMTIDHFTPRESGNSPFGSVGGTFSYTLTDEGGIDTIRVTEGRFRFNVPQIF